jgi:putative addiction module antidote
LHIASASWPTPEGVTVTPSDPRIVQTGSSLAVTLPREVVEQFKLKKGDPVDVSVHPQSGAIVVRTAVRHVEDGNVTARFDARAKKILRKYDKAFAALAK